MTKRDLIDALESIPNNAEIIIGTQVDCIDGLHADELYYNNEYNRIIISIYEFESNKDREIKEPRERIYEEYEFPYYEN